MLVKQILVAFWWMLVIAVIVISGLKINSLRLNVEPIDVAKDIALVANRMETLNINGNVTYFLEDNTDFKIEDGNINFLLKGVVVESYPFSDQGKINVNKKDKELIIAKE